MAKKSVAETLEKRRIEQFEVEDAARTLVRAEEIRKDKPMMKLVNKELEKKKAAFDEVMQRK